MDFIMKVGIEFNTQFPNNKHYFFPVYLDVGRAAGNTATLTFTVASAVALSRQWEAKVTQFHCGEAAA